MTTTTGHYEDLGHNTDRVPQAVEQAKKDPQRAKTGQSRMAHRFLDDARGKHLHVHGLGWLYWDGTRWAEDHGSKRVRRALRATLEAAWAEALGDRELVRDVKLCHSATGEKGALDIAATIRDLSAEVDELDQDPTLLNTPTGTVDLVTGQLLAHDPAHLITKRTNAAFDPDAPAPNWSRFLATSLPNVEVREFLQRYVGQALRGRDKEQRLAILTGAGSNGKSVWTEAVGHALGDYSFTGRPEMLLASRESGFDGSEGLRGVRWATFSEVERGQELGVAMVKRLTGTETIRAKVKHKPEISFTPSHSLAMIVNDLPEIKDTGHGIWRRVAVVPWTVIIDADAQDRELGQKLEAEAAAVLAWCLRGLAEYHRQGLADPEAVQLATRTYQAQSDQLVRFLDQCTVRNGSQGNVSPTALYAAYERWVLLDGKAAKWSTKEFREALSSRASALGLRQDRRRCWEPLTVRPDWEASILETD